MIGRSPWFAAGIAFLVTTPLFSQTQSDSSRGSRPVAPRIAHVIIEASDVFPDAESKGAIPKIANGLHITTRPGTIRRELLLKRGDPFDSAKAAETERNLRALRVFRLARIDTVQTDSGLVMRVRTQDAFSTRVEGSIQGSNKGSDRWIGLTELNLLGTATRVGLRYRQTSDRDALTTTFQRDRLIDGRVGLAALFDQRTDGHMAYGVVSLPYLSFSSKSAWYVSGEERQERVLRFREGDLDTRASLQRRYWMGRVGVGWAPSAGAAGYLHVGVDGQLRRDNYADSARVDTLGREVTAAITGYVQWRKAKFLVSSGIQGFGRDEDVDLSTVLHVGLGLTPKGFGYPDNGIVPNVAAKVGFGWRGGFGTVSGSVLGRLRESGAVDSGSAHLAALVVLKPATRHMAVLHASHGWQKNSMPGGEFDFGVNIGPRGFNNHAFTGDRSFLLTGEYRYTVTDRFLRSAGLALAGFADYGGAWFAGSARRTGSSIGVGVRFGFTVTTDLSPARLDFAYLNGPIKGWRVVVGKGFVFSTTGRLDR